MIDEMREFIIKKAKEFGAQEFDGTKRSYIERNNTGQEALKDNGAYFGLIHPEEEPSGPFHDFSITIFPNEQNLPWLVCLGIGSSGFKNDYELATYPGLRRLFSKLVDENGYCKTDFSDIETSLPKFILGHQKLLHIKNSIKTYSKVLPVCQIVENPSSEEGEKLISAFVAAYAKLRDWPSNKEHRDAISKALNPFASKNSEIRDEVEYIKNLLEERKFMILQGPPGTGKTRMAKKVAGEINASIFFTQFHAETSYSDFIYGIRPNVRSENLSYEENLGIFTKSLKAAREDVQKKVVLIIDEINRANLSNVLGPIFYLFEHKMDIRDVEVEISPGNSINSIPENFYVLATMNTADRSLAVVDFALRRRFAWYTLVPKEIVDASPENFYKEDFFAIQEIFNWYASTNELSLQPGQGYFIARSDEEMKNRIRYEIFPLIKEYLEEGLMKTALEEFNNYFMKRINKSLFE
ncbi:MAG: AAA family ATPase [Ignavibacteriaceae bacterium]|nr:AAA family ATPase [Ignavibacteriaceae bacterium]